MPSSTDRPNVLVVVCDTLRPDYLSPYGADFETSFFDGLADSGTLFENAYAAGPGTPVSHAALFSGQYPSTSGVGGQVDVPTDIPHVAEHFRDAGYETFGMPGPSRIGSHWQYDRGFDEYLEKWVDIPSSVSVEDLKKGVADPTLVEPMPREFLRRFLYGDDEYASYLLDVFESKTKGLDDPWLSFVNVTIAHGPFNPPRPYKREVIPEWERPPLGVLDRFVDERIDRPDVRADRVNAVQCAEGFARYLADQEYLTDEELDVLKALYTASVRYLDDQLAALFDGLEAAGDLENTVVVLLADHGEYLGERGLTSHEYLHFDEILHVPLLFTGPGVPTGERRTDLVSLVDIFPTLCDLTGIDAPEAVDGQSVFSGEPNDAIFAVNGVRETPDVYDEFLSAETLDWLQRGMKSVRSEEHFYTVDSAGEERLYTRPDEEEITDPDSDVLSTYRRLVSDRLSDGFPPGSQQDDYGEAIEANLRHLGYID
jgi:arylsulfatase A-like enzyme